jgi:hypothetical protein
MDCIAGAEMARKKGVTEGTHKKHSRSWDCWLGFLSRIGYRDDPYLEDQDDAGRLRICGAFMHAVRRGDFGRSRQVKQVKGGTARTTLENVAAKFVADYRRSPIANAHGKTHNHIERQTRGYKREDPSTKHEKALPPQVFRHRLKMAITPREIARAYLICGALFFAMRSCEFCYVGTGERKTRPIRLCDIVFRMGSRVLPHNSRHLHKATSVEINFGDQKSDIKDETVSMDNNGRADLNPVTIWAHIVRRVRSYPGCKDDWEIFTFHDGSTFSNISSREILTDLRASVDTIGKDVLGFSSDEIGTHSIRASFAMMAYLAKEPIYTIMLIGRWNSDAFLAYIEKQIKEFTKGVSSRMLENDTFFNIPLASNDRTDSTRNHSQSHHRRANLNIFGRQAGSLRHQLRPRN